ncbi:adenosylcobinamide-GDP ribazoletransferase [Marinifilum caeruleilacunae]|uniref:Adenosylcobinamide-GDP ribazoletransferase n=1 Tax=Marinifilum caeruleilacunae TaxID=2499076 RepID=A0ABX1WQ88_9BACT|nr:adenosylcobinamide-GDP ribazoletransferase [Marinifilum caeruleilacunae]NOU58245.1 adenosylcobinamide-GDP ribazoletransferase [Marinifilum caeruleilacunae]
MKRELNIFFTGLSFFTRLPFPKWASFKEEYQHEAIKYFPIAGLIIGGIAAFVFYLFNLLLPFNLAVIVSMAATALLTGALHEDGFMDVCDGFGGGWTKERILEIMKDSLIGAFGVTGIIFLIITKFYCQFSISANQLPLILIAAHSSTRMVAASLVNTHKYARVGNSKAKDYSQKLSPGNFIFMLITGILPLALLGNLKFFLILIPVYLCKVLLGRYYNKWIDGYTGDCIGATQQVCEVVFYLSYLSLLNYL